MVLVPDAMTCSARAQKIQLMVPAVDLGCWATYSSSLGRPRSTVPIPHTYSKIQD